MLKLTAIDRNLLVVAALTLLFCCDAFFWHVLPLGFEGMLAYGGLAFWFGASLSLLALLLAVVALLRHGRARSGLAVCISAAVILVAYATFARLS